MLVGSIKWLPHLEVPGATIRRGECMGYFRYGGSTVITLFPKGEMILDDDLIENSTEKKCETLVKVGWRVGIQPVES
jgi:phosphatidylserine decarboxylase